MHRAASLVALSLLAALAGACGGGSASGGADPASAVPADAPFYLEAVVRPEGDLREDALAAAGKVLSTDDPSGRISELVDKALQDADGTKLDYEKDIKPWLGERAGAWFTADADADADGEAAGAAIVAITDEEAALAAVGKARDGGGEPATKRSYAGTDYEVDQDGDAVGVAGDFLIAGSEAEFKRTLDTLKDGKTLADSDRYQDGTDSLADDRLGHFYADLKRLVEIGLEQQPEAEQQLRQFEQLVPLEKLGPLMGSFSADADRLVLDMTVDFSGAKALGVLGSLATGASTPLIQELPGGTWGAFGAPKYGEALRATLDQFAGAFGGAALESELRKRYGIDVDDDVLSWIGDVAFFVRGDNLATLDGGAVIQVTDEDKAASGFTKLVGLLRSFAGVKAEPIEVDGADAAFAVQDGDTPKPVVFARGSGKVVIAYGTDAAAQALVPSDKLGDAEVYGQAKDALEDLEPGFLLSIPAVISLVDAIGQADASWDRAKPYLEAYDVIAFGSEAGGTRAKLRVAAGLK